MRMLRSIGMAVAAIALAACASFTPAMASVSVPTPGVDMVATKAVTQAFSAVDNGVVASSVQSELGSMPSKAQGVGAGLRSPSDYRGAAIGLRSVDYSVDERPDVINLASNLNFKHNLQRLAYSGQRQHGGLVLGSPGLS